MLAAEDPSDPRLPGIIERAHHLGKSGLEEARRAIGMLRDDELPGPERLAGLAAQFHEVTGIPCQFTISGQAYELPSQARLAVYRVAQEALTNITKHACPERVEMHLGYEPRRTRLTVENFAMDTGTAASGRRRSRLRPDRDARAGRTARRRTHHSHDVRWLPRGVAGAGVSKPIRVLIADDQRVVREGLAMVLGLLPDVEVVGSASDGDEAVALAADLLPDIVLMDLRMPRRDGVEATRLLRDRVPQTTVVVLTTYADDRSVIDALQAGARGYLTKDAGGAEISQALRQVLDNHAVIDPAVQHHVVDAIATLIAGPGPAASLTSSRGSHSPGSRGTVTDRHRHVEPRDRRTPRRQRRHRQEPHQPPARQDRLHATVPKQSPSPISADLPRPGNSPAESPHRPHSLRWRPRGVHSAFPVPAARNSGRWASTKPSRRLGQHSLRLAAQTGESKDAGIGYVSSWRSAPRTPLAWPFNLDSPLRSGLWRQNGSERFGCNWPGGVSERGACWPASCPGR